MKTEKKGLMILAFLFLTAGALCFPFPAKADPFLMKESIINWNLKRHKASLSDGSYRGEEGILRITPEVGRVFGLKVLMNEDYLKAVELFKNADSFLKKAVEAMTTQKREKSPGQHERMVGEQALLYNESLRSARERLMAYQSKPIQTVDERLNQGICSELLEKLMEESLGNASNNLRDALASFYNRCQGINTGGDPLNPENVRFVNYVFQEVTKRASARDKERLDLDAHNTSVRQYPDSRWKHAMGIFGSHYASLLEPVLETYCRSGCSVDPLLFMALIKKESSFNSRAVSNVGAVGLAQIMPATAKSLGMENIFQPPYFHRARSLMARERELRRSAMALIPGINEENKVEYAKRARKLMQESIAIGRERKKLYTRYKHELLSDRADDRLDPRKSIECGFKYFVRMMKRQKGDISLALASYNAGPNRIGQYQGIPPYPETISFRNGVLRYYREYLDRLEK